MKILGQFKSLFSFKLLCNKCSNYSFFGNKFDDLKNGIYVSNPNSRKLINVICMRVVSSKLNSNNLNKSLFEIKVDALSALGVG